MEPDYEFDIENSNGFSRSIGWGVSVRPIIDRSASPSIAAAMLWSTHDRKLPNTETEHFWRFCAASHWPRRLTSIRLTLLPEAVALGPLRWLNVVHRNERNHAAGNSRRRAFPVDHGRRWWGNELKP
jgi:hypothetical protein